MAVRTKNKLEIRSVRVCREVDDNPDLSYLGEYESVAGKNAIDRKERGDQERGQYRYCNITLSAEETGNPDSVEQDYERMEAYNRGGWCMMGVYAEAEISVIGVCQTIRSGGLWGIESDSEDSYFSEVGAEELNDLRNQLEALGFSRREINEAFAEADKSAIS